ncbi:MAG TPA: type IV pilus assembly protein PilM [Vitreimonas sp.]|nr:type IV pilus assembly protein PilM [Vitreimonas sp.]
MPALALDIGTYTIKAISGKPGNAVQVTRALEIFNPLGVNIAADEAQLEKLAKLLDTTISDNNLPRQDVRLALPETMVSTKVISLPWLSDAELASAIGWQAEQHIPIPPEELSLEYQVLFRPKKADKNVPMRVLLVGARKSLIEKYVSVFTMIGLEPTVLETHIVSVIRSLQFTVEDPTTLVVHLGASTMDMAVMHQGELSFVFTHLNGGQLLTRSLEQTIGLTGEQAEQYKRSYGLDEAQFQGKVREAMLPAAKLLIGEMQKAIRFFINQHPTDSVQRVLLSGGSAQLVGMVQLITAELGVEVLIAAPFSQASGEIPPANHPAYSVCMGLLMREL